MLGDPPAGVRQSEITYTAEDGSKLRAKLYQPTSTPDEGSPMIVLFHGGGFCTGFPEGEEITARNLVLAFGAVCISASYRLAPKFPFPYAVKDAWDALKWAAANAKAIGADTSLGFIVGGSSAGGNISAVLAHLARDEALAPPLTGQYLSIPTVCPHDKVPEKYRDRYFSWEQNKDAPVLPAAAVDMFMSGYKPDPSDSTYYAILNHPKGHGNLPPACVMVDGLDPLRDEGLIYERVLREEYGLNTRLYVYPGVPHSHWSFFPMLGQSKQFRKDQIEAFGWLLNKQPKTEEEATT